MRNINLDNPYLLLLIIPAVLFIVLPFVLAFGKTNKNKHSTTSFILHLLIVACVVLAVATPSIITVMTKTQVYVLADVSHSSSRNLETIDGYIREVEANLPTNSQMGVITFGKNQKVTTPMGGTFVSVRGSGVDDSETNISAALEYVSTLFEEDAIKRIVLITDGKETDPDGKGKLITTIENLYSQDIHLDAVYLDNNLKETDKEVQVSDIEFSSTAYLGHDSTLSCLIQAAKDCQALVKLYQNDTVIATKASYLYEGYNTLEFSLPTGEAGSFDYRIEVESNEDVTLQNNSISFSQIVTGALEVLLISDQPEDLTILEAKYGTSANITSYIRNKKIPCTIEDLCKYDEIILSNVDIRALDNYAAFIDSLDKAVSIFGKSFLTMGDLFIQNKDDPALKQLEEMLPVTYGNNNQDNKYYIIVVDSSNSMNQASRLIMAREAALTLLDLFNEGDYVGIVNFWGDINIAQVPVPMTERAQIEEAIRGIKPHQGTMISTAVREAGKLLSELPDGEKQIILISDGMSCAIEEDTPDSVVADFYEDYDVVTSVINPYSEAEGTANLQKIAAAGQGNYFYLENESSLKDLILKEVADQITESLIDTPSSVNVSIPTDQVLEEILALPMVNKFLYTKEKVDAISPLTANYKKSEKVILALPLYSYHKYGNGRVATLTTSLSGDWTPLWNGVAETDALTKNILLTNTPKERIDYPYSLEITQDGTKGVIHLTPLEMSLSASATVKVYLPYGRTTTGNMAFDSEKYIFSFDMPYPGTYKIEITYTNGTHTYLSTSHMSTTYAPEYNDFTIFDASLLNAVIRDRGTLSEGTIPSLENNKDELATYILRLTAPLMTAAVVLYIVDIIIRKLKWSDIKGLFKPSRKKGGTKQ